MRNRTISAILSLAALFGPWLLHPALRHRHATASAIATAVLLLLSWRLKRPFRARHLAQPLLLAATSPLALVQASGLPSRIPLVVATIVLLAGALSWRLLDGIRTARAGECGLSALMARAFPDLAPIAAAELRLFWFGLFRWRRTASDLPLGAEPFSATATGTEVAMCWLTAAGFLVERPLLHILLAHLCGPAVAWICTGLHAILAIYLAGYAKSLLFRPTLLFPDRLEIRLGVVARRIVPRALIESVLPHDGKRPRSPDEQRLYGLDRPNLRLGLAGGGLLLRVDDPARLMRALRA
ncbi:hypothetical protein NFI95_06940 [Acetobacteraceae bacterium KSS8]|uniref:Uncharacterized protein n=1 Tax=Endosaccharibacter trunci TaxID=2812733 RepID=A0ABT1W5L2_9PROT|nr:hypothetical protein [Acetobacteraceae bacterium KSS8]